MDNLEGLLSYFGYTDHSGKDNNFEFFTYGNKGK